MKRLLTVVPVLLLAAACGTSAGGATRTTTVTRTVTESAGASGQTPASSAPGTPDPSAPTSAATAMPDACSLLTQAEAEKVAGTTLLKPVGAGATSTGGFVMCQFTGPTSGPTAQVEVYVGDGAEQQLHIERDNLKHPFTTVPGVGDQCLAEDDFVFVLKHGLWASIRLVRLNDPKQNAIPLRTGITALAARLP